jgi:hypothetical protein
MLKNARFIISSVAESNARRINGLNRRILTPNSFCSILQRTKKTNPALLTSLFKPVELKNTHNDDINVGAELTGAQVDKSDIIKILNKFTQRREIRLLCLENGLDSE